MARFLICNTVVVLLAWFLSGRVFASLVGEERLLFAFLSAVWFNVGVGAALISYTVTFNKMRGTHGH